ncbi:DUF4296 domain-containing protein [Nonlabens antarcticus]|uniref:DUF4296 domain-containing protein n=1 Tax=Nonlabens antarcticus TaxID=392714 RepID=UPI00189155FA|nr:DUF4296 domain-containing protein [Nonlabens antarcticus]
MKKLMSLLFLLIIASCSSVLEAPKPEDFYGDDKMAEIMTDLYLMEASMTSDRGAFTALEMLPHDYIYKKHDTDSIVFKENLYYYSDRIEKYENVIDLVEERLDILRDSVAVRQEKEMRLKEAQYKNTDRVLINDIEDPDNQIEN